MSEASSTGWKKSSFSLGATACLELRRVGEEIAMRNSRYVADEQAYTQDEFRAFIAGVKAGEFDYLLV